MTTHRPPGTFCWYELATSDAHAATEFYGRVFGWTFAEDAARPGGTAKRVLLAGDALGRLFELGADDAIPPHWMFHVAVEDVATTVQRVEELGGQVLAAPAEVAGVGRVAQIADATGARLSLLECDGRHGTAIDPAATGGFGWTELQTRDAARARAFYGDLFGWQAKADTGAVPYTEYSLPGQPPFAGMIEMDDRWHGAPPAWLGYVMVEDCDATFERATAHGARPIVPPAEIDGVGRFAVITDPQGAVLALIRLATH